MSRFETFNPTQLEVSYIDISTPGKLERARPALLGLIDCNSLFLAHLKSQDALSIADTSSIESIQDKTVRNAKLLDILETRLNGTKLLSEALKATKQSGAYFTLNKFECAHIYMNASEAIKKDSEQDCNSSTEFFRICRSKADEALTLFKKARRDLQKILNNENVNTKIIEQLRLLEIFDDDEIEPILENTFNKEHKRMNDLFNLIENLELKDIAQCIEKLCNLDGLPRLSSRIRQVFIKYLPCHSQRNQLDNSKLKRKQQSKKGDDAKRPCTATN